jgi:hypothetical protein
MNTDHMTDAWIDSGQYCAQDVVNLRDCITSLQSRLEAAEGALRTAVDSANHFGSEFERLAMGLGLEYTAPEMVAYLLQHDEDVRERLSSAEQENAKLRNALEDAINLIEVSSIVETPPYFSDDLKQIKAVADQKGPKA